MWLMLNDAFLSIVKKDCPLGHLLVRARREGDIEKVFGRRVRVERKTDSDYLFRAVVPIEIVVSKMGEEVHRIDYSNFKNSVDDSKLHDAYSKVWTTMAALQNPRPYSTPYQHPPFHGYEERVAQFEEGTLALSKRSSKSEAERRKHKQAAGFYMSETAKLKTPAWHDWAEEPKVPFKNKKRDKAAKLIEAVAAKAKRKNRVRIERP